MYNFSIKKRFLQLFAFIFCFCITLNFLTISATAEVTYEGRGSKSNPYLVKTAAQLDGMRNNLSAHYKLANTIDLSGYAKFEPIGHLDEPFTGSLVCETNSDGTPQYAIKNLIVNIDAGIKNNHAFGASNYPDYVKNKSNWEAALFGATDGATLENIVVLNANITNTVIGQSQMNSDYSVNPGQDEMAAAVLVGIAKNTNFSGCGSTGEITSRSNHTGGLVGILDDGSILKNSYSYATVTSEGWWCVGGLVGTVRGEVDGCFYSGDVSGGRYNVGALVGQCSTSIKNSYAEGTVAPSNANSFLGSSYATTISAIDVCENCYTLSKILDRTSAQSNKKVQNNNYITNEAGALQVGFAAATKEEIANAFKTLPDWTIGTNGYPQPKNVHPVKDASKYVPLSVTKLPGTESESISAPAESTANNDTLSEEQTSQANEGMNQNQTEEDTETLIQDTDYKMSTAELVLIIVLSSLTVIMIGIGTYVIILIYRTKKA